MNLEPRILQPTDLEQVIALEKSKIKQNNAKDMSSEDFMLAEMSSWSASWRQEALEHYLPQGWSYCLCDSENKVQAYAIAQPQLFVHALTQNLWVEHMHYESPEQAQLLLDLLYRTCRDKHFQSLRLKESAWAEFMPANAKPLEEETSVHTFKTAKIQ